MSNKKQTAVDWQHIELMRINFEYATNKITPREFQEQTKYILEKAKEMEKEQIVDAIVQHQIKHHDLWSEKGILQAVKQAEHYYNQTYNTSDK